MASTTTTTVYKGKVTHRSWAELPEELVRMIGTFFLLEGACGGYCPQGWEVREAWQQRMVYTALRDAAELERHLMAVCPQWHLALQHHLFWNQAVAVLDPTDAVHAPTPTPASALPHSAPAPSPFHHFRSITRASCFVCRVNAPNSATGLAAAKRLARHNLLRTIALCRDHDRRPTSFCGMCLRAAPVYDPALVTPHAAAQQEHYIGVVDNDDKDTFPAVDATCRACRIEWLWKRAGDSPGDREAIGGHRFEPADWETRNVVDAFIDLAEGSIKDVLLLAREKLWLRKNTRLDFMLKMLKKTNKVDTEGLDGLDRYDEEEESSDSEEDIELLQMEEAHVRDMALGDWARARILDGHWVSPADTWYRHTVNGYKDHVPAVHPCPWTCSPRADDDDGDEGGAHPLPATLRGTIPPTFGLCEQAFSAHQRQLKEILLPPMRNLVRKLVIECQMGCGSEDPAVRAARMGIEDVLAELRGEEGVWLYGFDWAQRRMNDARARERGGRRGSSAARGDSDDSSVSSGRSPGSDSNGTSPVLSTTTLQTTPSPPPPTDDEKKTTPVPVSVPVSVPVVIAVDPVEDPPRPIHAVPYVPTTAAHFPPYTLDALKSAWREACAPLYRCRCSICLRAAARAGAGGATRAAKVVPPPPPVQARTPETRAVELSTVALEEVVEVDVDGEGEEEVGIEDDVDTYDEDEEEDEEEEEEEEEARVEFEFESEGEGSEGGGVGEPVRVRPGKRSSDELESDEVARRERERGGTPPKRARTTAVATEEDEGEERSAPAYHLAPAPAPVPPDTDAAHRLRKRRSEELDDVPRRLVLAGRRKKVKVGAGVPCESPPPTTATATTASDGSSSPRVSS